MEIYQGTKIDNYTFLELNHKGKWLTAPPFHEINVGSLLDCNTCYSNLDQLATGRWWTKCKYTLSPKHNLMQCAIAIDLQILMSADSGKEEWG